MERIFGDMYAVISVMLSPFTSLLLAGRLSLDLRLRAGSLPLRATTWTEIACSPPLFCESWHLMGPAILWKICCTELVKMCLRITQTALKYRGFLVARAQTTYYW